MQEAVNNPSAATAATNPPERTPPAGLVLLRIFALLDRAGIPYCLLDSYEHLPRQVPAGDMDLVMPAEVLPGRLASLLHANVRRIGAQVIRWRIHDSHYITLAGKDKQGVPFFLRLDVHPGYKRDNRLYYSAQEVLSSRRRHEHLWAPTPDLEFACYLVKKVAKRTLNPDFGQRLSELYQRDPAGCQRQIDRFWSGPNAQWLTATVQEGKWEAIDAHLDALRSELRQKAAWKRPGWMARNLLAKVAQKIRSLREWHDGVHVVLLGPDGCGKTTTIEGLEKRMASGFWGGIASGTTAPALINKANTWKRPHAKTPHSYLGSIAQAIYWMIYYGLGWFVTTCRKLRDGKLLLSHRHFVDSLVDAKRYRYAGPRWLLKLVWRLAPKPDVVIVLDAPPEVVHARKQELPLEELAAQRHAYRALAQSLDNAHIVNASQPVNKVLEQVEQIIITFMADRTWRRLGVEKT